jgi:hypothetical protein
MYFFTPSLTLFKKHHVEKSNPREFPNFGFVHAGMKLISFRRSALIEEDILFDGPETQSNSINPLPWTHIQKCKEFLHEIQIKY